MFAKDYIISQFEYNFWANRRVWECVSELSEEQFTHPLDYSIGSIRLQCQHTMVVEHWWFRYLSRGEIDFMEDVDISSRDAIRQRWDKVEQQVMVYLYNLTPEELEREVCPPFWDDDEPPIKVWQAIQQVAAHGSDHRAQTLAGVHYLGGRTVSVDLLEFLFEGQKSL